MMRNKKDEVYASSFYIEQSERLHMADDGEYLALDANLTWLNIDWIHVGMRRLEANAPAFLVEVFEGRFIAVGQPHGNHIAVLSRFLTTEDHDVAFTDHGINH